jgi:hypothetical protein
MPAQAQGPAATATTSEPQPTSPLLELTPVIGTTPLPTQPSMLPGKPPPITIALPEGWAYSYQVIPISDQFIQATTNLAIYQGPIRNATATIIVLWGFPALSPVPTSLPLPGTATVIPGTPAPDLMERLLWANGLRLLQGTVVDITCNVGHYGLNPRLTVGGLPAVGENFSASQCQGEPETVGWFAGVNQNGISILFYAYIEPIELYNDARGDLQKILDSVTFPPIPTATATVQATPTAMP